MMRSLQRLRFVQFVFAIANTNGVTIGKFDCIVFENFAKIDMTSFTRLLPETENIETLEFFKSLDDPEII